MGFSVFGNYNVQDNLDVVARYDYYDPNSDSNVKGDSRNYIIAGLNWKADKNVWFMPNFQIETYESNPNGTTYGSAVTGRVTMYYVFL
jgi:phosphate-selective porin